MKISTKGRYALRLMIDLAENGEGIPIRMRDIAERQDVSAKYLEQIAIRLTKAKLLKGTRGPGGGYRLSRRPEECSTREILLAAESTLAPVPCVARKGRACSRKNECRTFDFWRGLYEVTTAYLESKKLSDLVSVK